MIMDKAQILCDDEVSLTDLDALGAADTAIDAEEFRRERSTRTWFLVDHPVSQQRLAEAAARSDAWEERNPLTIRFRTDPIPLVAIRKSDGAIERYVSIGSAADALQLTLPQIRNVLDNPLGCANGRIWRTLAKHKLMEAAGVKLTSKKTSAVITISNAKFHDLSAIRRPRIGSRHINTEDTYMPKVCRVSMR